MSSVHKRLAVACATVAGASSVTIKTVTATVNRIMVSQVREALEALPVVLVCIPEEAESSKPFATGGFQDKRYLVQFLIVGAANRDPTIADDLLDARAVLMSAFQRPDMIRSQGIPEVLQTEIVGGSPISKQAFLKNYALSAFSVRFRCIEST